MLGRDMAIGIIQQWVAEGMSSAEANKLFREIATGDLGAYVAEVEVEKLETEDEEELSVDVSTQLEVVLAMPPLERRVFLLEEKVELEQHWLDSMLEDWRVDRSVDMPTIREQRKRVQLWQRRLNEASQKLAKNGQSIKQSQSSKDSET